jgi:hypothetical protein
MSNTHGNFTFDGPNKRITLSAGTVQFSSSEIYSRWKDWCQEDSDRLKYDSAFANSVGGDSLGGGVLVGAYYFLQNGWVIRPQEADHTLVVSGNLFPIPDTAAMFTYTVGDYQVVVGMRTSSLTQSIIQSAASSTTAIADAVWSKDISSSSSGAGKDLTDTKNNGVATLGLSA